MTNFRCELLLDSISSAGARATTFSLCYERGLLHADLMTYRQFSRNASGSRAIPYSRMRDWIVADPAVPLSFGLAQKGMVGAAAPEEHEARCRKLWLDGLRQAVATADAMYDAGCHKEACNRLLEPWGWINVLVTSTNYEQFFRERCAYTANPNIQRLAVHMARLYRASVPTLLPDGEWHLPYISETDKDEAYLLWCNLGKREVERRLCLVSGGRCRRVSLRSHEDNVVPSVEDDYRRGLECIENGHVTPLEHQLTPTFDPLHQSGNIVGYIQFRKQLPTECTLPKWQGGPGFDYSVLDRAYSDRDFRLTP